MKIKYSIYMLMVASLGLASCGADDENICYQAPIQHKAETAAVQLKASHANELLLSKTTLVNGWGVCVYGDQFAWVAFQGNETLDVFAADGKGVQFGLVTYYNDNEAHEYNAVFGGEIDEADGYYALYPYQENASIKGNVISANIPSVQTFRHDNMDGDAALSVAYTDAESRDLKLRNVTSMLMIHSQNHYSKITLETIDKTPIAGDVAITVGNDGAIEVKGGTENVITMGNGISKSGYAYYVHLLPGKIKAGNLKITFTCEDGSEMVSILDKDLDMKRGYCYRYGVPYGTILVDYSAIDKENVLYTVYDGSSMRISAEYNLPDDEGMEWGLSTSKDGEIEYGFGSYFGGDAPSILYLVQKPIKKFKLTIDANGGKFSDDKSVFVKELSRYDYFKVWDSWPTFDGYELRGFINSDSSYVDVFDGLNRDTTITAVWNKLYKFTVLDRDGEKAIMTEYFTKSTWRIERNWDLNVSPDEKFLGFMDQDGNYVDFNPYFYPGNLKEFKDIVLKPVFAKPNAEHKGWDSERF